jgi:hypothetical protein
LSKEEEDLKCLSEQLIESRIQVALGASQTTFMILGPLFDHQNKNYGAHNVLAQKPETILEVASFSGLKI